jgi:hypothetical protein
VKSKTFLRMPFNSRFPKLVVPNEVRNLCFAADDDSIVRDDVSIKVVPAHSSRLPFVSGNSVAIMVARRKAAAQRKKAQLSPFV